MRRTPALAVVAALAAVATALPLLTMPGAGASARPDRGPDAVPTGLSWQRVGVDSDEQFRGLDVVDRRTAWVGGSAGSVFRTTDGGRTWEDVSPRGAEGLLFRDVEAPGRRPRQRDGDRGGQRLPDLHDHRRRPSWHRAFTNHDPAAFYDCMAFWPSGRHGIAMSDPVNGKFRIIAHPRRRPVLGPGAEPGHAGGGRR